jgi:hypothetical protein
MIPYMISDNTATAVVKGKVFSITSDQPNFGATVKALRNGDAAEAQRLLDIPSFVSFRTRNQVAIKNGKVFYKDREVHNYVATKILEMSKQGFDCKYLMNFLENLYKNPLESAIAELFIFLENSSLPITKDGHFLAYKRVASNYFDIYSGKFDHSIGQVVEEDRKQLCTDRQQTCARGLHFCSLSYLPHYRQDNGHIMIVKINPKDVIAIPYDYDNAKGRTCKYTVVSEYEGDETDHAFITSVVGRVKKKLNKASFSLN